MSEKIKLKAVVLVPYVASSVGADIPHAEAEYFYKNYFYDSETYQVIGSTIEGRIYIKDSVGLYIIGEGKINSAITTTALLMCDNFNLDNTKFILCGCCGSARDIGVVGDIYFISETIDSDLGHHVDIRDKDIQEEPTWYPNKSFYRYGYVELRNNFFTKSYQLVNDINISTTENTKNFMSQTFNGESWAVRDPKIMIGASITSDTYWKGNYNHDRAISMCQYYRCIDPYLATQMEDVAIAQVFKNFNRLEDILIIRYSVNMDVFMNGQTPNNLWGHEQDAFDDKAFEDFDDIFPVVTKSATDIVWNIVNKI